jgi:Flp pilus assembly protein TadB
VNWLGFIEKLIRPLMLALGLWKVKQAGRDAAAKEQLEKEAENADEARKARDALERGDIARDELRDRYRR